MRKFKQFLNESVIKEDYKVVVIHTKNGKVDFIEKGEYMIGRGGGTIFVRDAGVNFDDFAGMDPKAAKDSLVKFSRYDPKKIIIETCNKVEESWMPDSETISWLKDYLKDVKRGEGWVDIDKVVYDADIELNKDLSKNKKELADYIKRIGDASLLKESAKVITEARKVDDRKVDFDNLGGGIQFTRGIHGLYANMFSGGNGFSGEWNSKEYMNAVTSNDSHVFDDYLENTEKKLVKELADLCSKFDKDFERLMNKYGFKK